MRPLSVEEFDALRAARDCADDAPPLPPTPEADALEQVFIDLQRQQLMTRTVRPEVHDHPDGFRYRVVSYDLTARGRHAIDIHRAFLASQGGLAR